MSEEYQPISPILYQYLRQRFGSIKVANAGYSMIANRPTTPLAGRMRSEILHAGEYYRVCCPYCGDTRHRLWINHRYGQLNGDGYRDTWLACCYNEDCTSELEQRRDLEDKIFGFRNRNDRKNLQLPLIETDRKVMQLRPHEPPGDITLVGHLQPNHPARIYLEQTRGYDINMLHTQYNVAYCNAAVDAARVVQNRIIIPVYMGHVCVGWQARLPFDADKSWHKTYNAPKYYTCPTMPKSQVLYNYDIAKTYGFIVVQEGVTDVWSTGPFATATLGASMSWPQKSLLMYEQQGKPVVFMYDPAAWDVVEGLVADFVKARTNPIVKVRLPDGTDPGSFQPDDNIRMIVAAATQQGVNLPMPSTAQLAAVR